MINFPDSPTLNQVFQGPNGISYTWNGTLWLVQNTFAGGTGDFCVNQTSSFPAIPAADGTLIFTQVYSGNSGLWYSTSTGRYSPPAGRYAITAGYTAFGAALQTFTVSIRKNGTTLQANSDTGGSSNQWANPTVTLTVDANGTDWFDIQASSSSGGGGTAGSMYFQAFPLTGMQGPPGVVGSIGQRIEGAFGAGGIPADTWTVGVGWSTSVNDTGVSQVGNTWTPPAGRWLIQGCFQLAAPVATQIGACLCINGALTDYQQVITGSGGSTGVMPVGITLVRDYDGATPISWALFGQGPSTVITAQSWWTATRVK